MNFAGLVAEHARNEPDRIALILNDIEVSYAQLDAMAARVGTWLLENGVTIGDRVLFYSENSIEFLATYLGAARIGAVFAPIHPSFKHREMGYVAQNSRATVAFVSASLSATFQDMAETIPELPKRVVVVGDGYTGPWHTFRDVLTSEGWASIVDVEASTPVLISYTSGSTAAPKPVERSHGAEIWSARTYADVWDYRPEDRALVALPLTWAYGISTTTSALFAAGATVVLLPHFNPVQVLDTIERAAITLFAGSSTMFVKMLDVYRKGTRDLSSLRNCYVGAEPINRSVTDAFAKLVNSRIWEGYASTEAFPILVTHPRSDADAPRDTCGRLVPGAQLRIVDEVGVEVAPGEVGEAQFTCPGQMLTYFGESDLTHSRLTPDGWVRSGDLLRCDENGYFFVVGRLSDMIIRGGANIAPAEVESAIVALDGVLDATVTSVADAANGEAVVAFVSTDGGKVNEAEVREHVEARLASYKVPSRYFIDVVLPHSGNGKKDRRSASSIAQRLMAEPTESAASGE